MRNVLAGTVTVAAVLVGCGDPVEVVLPDSPDEGIQATGTIDGARVAVSRGTPTVVLGDCEVGGPPDTDLCITGRTIDGLDLGIVLENPAALTAGTSYDVVPCDDGCDDVTDGAVVHVTVAGDARSAERGTVDLRAAGPRWTADFDLALPGGDRLIGTFDVEP